MGYNQDRENQGKVEVGRAAVLMGPPQSPNGLTDSDVGTAVGPGSSSGNGRAVFAAEGMVPASR
jgi:hypothetical protein